MQKCFWMILFVSSMSSCVSVHSGSGAVRITSDGRMSQLTEGQHFLSPLDQVDIFNLREQGMTERFVTLTADGVPVLASDSLVSYHIASSELVALDREIGPDYRSTVIDPIVSSAVRRVLASYRWSELDSTHIRIAQDRITKLAAQKLRPYYIELESILIRNLTAQLPLLQQAINSTSIVEQKSLTALEEIELARYEASRKRNEADGIVSANRTLNPSLTSAVLKDAEIKAWEALSISPNTEVIVLPNNFSSIVEVTP